MRIKGMQFSHINIKYIFVQIFKANEINFTVEPLNVCGGSLLIYFMY